MPKADYEQILGALAKDPGREIKVDLERCEIRMSCSLSIPFVVSPSRRTALLEGLDDIQLTLRYVSDIDAFEAFDGVARPWMRRPRHLLADRRRADDVSFVVGALAIQGSVVR